MILPKRVSFGVPWFTATRVAIRVSWPACHTCRSRSLRQRRVPSPPGPAGSRIRHILKLWTAILSAPHILATLKSRTSSSPSRVPAVGLSRFPLTSPLSTGAVSDCGRPIDAKSARERPAEEDGLHVQCFPASPKLILVLFASLTFSSMSFSQPGAVRMRVCARVGNSFTQPAKRWPHRVLNPVMLYSTVDMPLLPPAPSSRLPHRRSDARSPQNRRRADGGRVSQRHPRSSSVLCACGLPVSADGR